MRRRFYARHGVKLIAAYPSPEKEREVSVMMLTKHCVRFAMNTYPKQATEQPLAFYRTRHNAHSHYIGA